MPGNRKLINPIGQSLHGEVAAAVGRQCRLILVRLADYLHGRLDTGAGRVRYRETQLACVRLAKKRQRREQEHNDQLFFQKSGPGVEIFPIGDCTQALADGHPSRRGYPQAVLKCIFLAPALCSA